MNQNWFQHFTQIQGALQSNASQLPNLAEFRTSHASLIDGFASLMADLKIHQQVLSQQAIVDQLAQIDPRLLHTLPPLSLLAFTPRLAQTTPVASGTTLSQQVDGDYLDFETLTPVQVLPIEIAQIHTHQQGLQQHLSITLKSMGPDIRDCLQGQTLNIAFRPVVHRQIAHHLLNQPKIKLLASGKIIKKTVDIAIRPLWQQINLGSFMSQHPYTLLQAFYHYPDLFCAYQIGPLALPETFTSQTLTLRFTQTASAHMPATLSPQDCWLHVTPIIARTRATAVPIRKTTTISRHHVQIDLPNRDRYALCDVHRVVGSPISQANAAGDKTHYQLGPAHVESQASSSANPPSYQLIFEANPTGLCDMQLYDAVPGDKIISADLIVCPRDLQSRLPAGQFENAHAMGNQLRYVNVTDFTLTQPAWSFTQRQQHLMIFRQQEALSIEALKAAISCFGQQAHTAMTQCSQHIESLISLRIASDQCCIAGRITPALAYHYQISCQHFHFWGDYMVFLAVIQGLLKTHESFSHIHLLTVSCPDTGTAIHWHDNGIHR